MYTLNLLYVKLEHFMRISVCKVFLYLYFSFFLPYQIFSQKEGIEAIAVSVAGDTLSVLVKPDRAERLSSYIQVFDPATQTFKRRTTKDFKYFKIGNDEYVAKKGMEGYQVFMQVIVQGEVSMYRHTYRRKKGSGYKTEEQDYYEKKNQGLFPIPQGAKFREAVASYFAEHPEIPGKIRSRQYSEANSEDIALEYNDWTKAGKPRIGPSLTTGPMLVQDVFESNAPNLAVELAAFATHNFVNYPNLLNDLYRSDNPGFGYDVGLGFKVRIKRGLIFRAGFNFRNKGYKATGENVKVGIIDDTTGSLYLLSFNEKAQLNYPGFFFNFGHEWKYFFISGGLNLSPFSFYRGDYNYAIYTTLGQLVASRQEKNVGYSYLVHELISTPKEPRNFNFQTDVQFSFGGNFSVSKNLALKPCIQYSVPLIPLYYSNQYVNAGTSQQQMLNVSGYQLKLGLIAEFGLK